MANEVPCWSLELLRQFVQTSFYLLGRKPGNSAPASKYKSSLDGFVSLSRLFACSPNEQLAFNTSSLSELWVGSDDGCTGRNSSNCCDCSDGFDCFDCLGFANVAGVGTGDVGVTAFLPRPLSLSQQVLSRL